MHPNKTNEYYDEFIQAVSHKISLTNLKKSLIFFENEFGDYINSLQDKEKTYTCNVQTKWVLLLKFLKEKEYINPDCKNYVLNFNYTFMDKYYINDLLRSNSLQTIEFALITYVHGIASLHGCRCIIGIDDTTVPHKFQEFTKSYLIISDKCYCQGHNDDLFFNKPFMLKEDYKKMNIFFYGHSLAKKWLILFFCIIWQVSSFWWAIYMFMFLVSIWQSRP